MPQALGLPTLLILALAAPAAMADSYYLGVTGGYSQFRDAQFEIGADSGTRVTGNYGGGDTLSLTLGHASEGSSTYNGRAEFEFGFQRDTVDSMRFDDTAGDEGTRSRIHDVSGTTDVAYGFYNAMGDFNLTTNTNLTAGFGFGLGQVTFEQHSARSKGLVMDDDDITYGYQLTAGLSYRLLSALDLELIYRYRAFNDVSLVAEDGAKSKLSLSSHNALAGFRVRF
jgi:opacity protein-like surface antigen